jgi:hypothetical protein
MYREIPLDLTPLWVLLRLTATHQRKDDMKNLRNLFLSTAIAASAPFSAQAFCGFYAGKADANLFNEASQVVMVRDGKRTVISMLNDYKGPLSEFALIVPTPTTLQKGQVRVADKLTFERLDAYSSPRLAEYHDNDPCQVNFNWGWDDFRLRKSYLNELVVPAPAAAPALGAVRDKALGVTVEAQYTLEEYDIVSLSATQSDGLETWLNENGYKIPQGASAALKPYINQGMKFFVAKVNLKEQLKTGYTTLRPLQFAFESEKFMLPMRLGMLNAPHLHADQTGQGGKQQLPHGQTARQHELAALYQTAVSRLLQSTVHQRVAQRRAPCGVYRILLGHGLVRPLCGQPFKPGRAAQGRRVLGGRGCRRELQGDECTFWCGA